MRLMILKISEKEFFTEHSVCLYLTKETYYFSKEVLIKLHSQIYGLILAVLILCIMHKKLLNKIIWVLNEQQFVELNRNST